MTQFLTQEELLEALGEEAERVPEAVFIAPKATDRGFAARRKAKTDFQTRVANLAADASFIKLKLERLTAEIDRLNEAVKATTDEGVATTLSARIAAAELDLKAAYDEMMSMVPLQDDLNREQVEFLLPYFKAIKYPIGEDGWKYKPRPKTEGPDLDAFLEELRPLVADVSEDDLRQMMEALVPSKGGSAVP